MIEDHSPPNSIDSSSYQGTFKGEDKFSDAYVTNMYKIYREYANSENTLINHRLVWLVTIQSGLLVGFGYSYQKYYEVAYRIYQDQHSSLRSNLKPVVDSHLSSLTAHFTLTFYVIIFAGFITCFVAFISVNAAVKAQRRLERQWTKSFKVRAEAIGLPFIAGGGNKAAVFQGDWLALAMPIVLSALWILTILAVTEVHVLISFGQPN